MHGCHNYAASLKFLWKYAQVIGDKNISGTCVQLSANAKNVALALFNGKYIKLYNPNNDYYYLNDLAIRTEAVINTYGKTKTPEERKYLIYGVILHLLGDITAHRTIVPQFMVDRATDSQYANSKNKFDKSDFPNNWDKIKSEVKNGRLCFNHIKDYVSDAEKNYVRNRYEDNTKVVPNRVLAAETMADYFMHYFSSGFNISILDNIPYANVKLINYIDYRNQG